MSRTKNPAKESRGGAGQKDISLVLGEMRDGTTWDESHVREAMAVS